MLPKRNKKMKLFKDVKTAVTCKALRIPCTPFWCNTLSGIRTKRGTSVLNAVFRAFYCLENRVVSRWIEEIAGIILAISVKVSLQH